MDAKFIKNLRQMLTKLVLKDKERQEFMKVLRIKMWIRVVRLRIGHKTPILLKVILYFSLLTASG
jgi:hypothetical protein